MVINNGYLSPQASLQRGLTKGCPLSLPLLGIQVKTRNLQAWQTIQKRGTNRTNYNYQRRRRKNSVSILYVLKANFTNN